MTVRALALTFFLCITAPAIAGVGDLTVSPTRIVFDGKSRSAQVTLINRGSAPATYRIGFTQMRMQEDGQLIEIDTPNEREKFLDRYIRFAPRQIRLEPEIGQTVRLLLRKPVDLPPGEYRSHLLFYAIPDENAGQDIERVTMQGAEGLEIALRPIFRFSIPVILRHGSLNADFEITDLRLKQATPPSVELTMIRDGNRSVYGDLDVYYYPNAAAKPLLLHHSKDFVIYTSNDRRTIELPLSLPADTSLTGGKLKVTFYKTQQGVRTVLAEKEFTPE